MIEQSTPLISGDCAVLAMVSVILAILLLWAVVGLCIHIRRAVLGKALLDACDDDVETARNVIERQAAANAMVTDLFTLSIAVDHMKADTGIKP